MVSLYVSCDVCIVFCVVFSYSVNFVLYVVNLKLFVLSLFLFLFCIGFCFLFFESSMVVRRYSFLFVALDISLKIQILKANIFAEAVPFSCPSLGLDWWRLWFSSLFFCLLIGICSCLFCFCLFVYLFCLFAVLICLSVLGGKGWFLVCCSFLFSLRVVPSLFLFKCYGIFLSVYPGAVNILSIMF